MFLRMASVVALSLAAAACAGGPPLEPRADLTVVDANALPAPTSGDLVLSGRDYVLGPGDILSVEVFGLPELTREVQLDSTGAFSMPMAGTVQATGKSPSDVARAIEAGLGNNFVRNPRATVNLKRVVSQVVTVSGEVEEPGVFPVTGPTTLLRSIAQAKGLSDMAQAKHVVVLRTVGGQHLAALYDLRAISRGFYADPQIYANDVVLVGESQSRRFFQNMIQGSSLITTPIIGLLQVL